MTIKTSIFVAMEAGQAKTELRALKGELDKTSAGVKALDKAATDAAGGVDTLGDKADETARKVKNSGDAADKASGQTDKLAKTNVMAAGSVGNLVAQFNDVGMMMAAGQNPFMLAIQQGSQISQVIGPMGAAGAVQALGAAFLGMLNPVNLAVMGSIAGLALVTQWLFSAGDAADAAGKDVADFSEMVGRLDAVLNRVEAYQFDGKFDGMEADAAKIEARFQTILGIVKEVQAAALKSALDAVREPAGLRDAMEANLRQTDMAARYGTEAPAFDFMGLDSLYEAKLVMISLREIEGETREEILKSVEATSEKLMLLGLLTPEVQQHLATIAEELGLQKQIAQTVEVRGEAEASAAATVGGLVAALLADLTAASQVDLASAFGNATGPAAQLLGIAGALVQKLASIAWVETMQPGGTGNLAGQYAQYGAGRAAFNTAAQDELGFSGAPPVPKAVRVSGGGGGGAAKAEADAVADLIAKLREEQQLLLETDPVQREMLKHREVLAEASEAERAEIEQLIRAENQLKDARESAEFFGRESLDFIKGLTREGATATDVIQNLASSIADAALQAIWLGEGPLAGLFGTGSGGVFGALVSGLTGSSSSTGTLGLPSPFAEGGPIYGEGSGTADKMLIRASAGEYMINARSAARYRPVLDRINAGDDIPGFASGGRIGGVGPELSGLGSDDRSRAAEQGSAPVINVINQSSAPVTGAVEQSTDSSGKRRYDLVLSDAVATGITAPGGAANKAMQRQYRGLKRGGIPR